MDKPIRKAVRCYLIKDNEVVVTKYKKGNKKEGYYDIPGGKIEEGESPKQTAIREMKEETGIEIQNLKYKGINKCGNSAEYGYSGISAEEPHFCGQISDNEISVQMKVR